MAKFSDDLKRVVQEQRLGYAATVCPDGTPNLSPKGTGMAMLLADNVLSHPGEIAGYLAALEDLGDFDRLVVPVGKGLSVAYRGDRAIRGNSDDLEALFGRWSETVRGVSGTLDTLRPGRGCDLVRGASGIPPLHCWRRGQ